MKPNEKAAGAIKVGKDSGRVKVFVRVRPQRSQENSRREPLAVTVSPDKKSGQIHVSDPRHSWEKTYTFDHVFPPQAPNSEVCSMISRPLVNSAMNGFNGTLMAYGQTGSGKTYTLMAPDGITAAVIDRCFKKIALDERHDYKVTMAYLQIYQEKLYDLLNSNSKVELSIREHPLKGIYVENLSSFVVRCSTDVNSLLAVGRKRLVFAETKMNRTSSRSHSVCQLTIERTLNKEKAKPEVAVKETTSRNGLHVDSGHKGSATAGKNSKVCNGYASKYSDDEEQDDNEDEPLTKMAAFDNDDVLVRGKIYLCDLAGSERLKKTQAEGERLSEAQHINSSLLELGNVIQALAEGKKNHVPFRNSTLTRLLQESLGGNCKTSLMVCVAPSMSDVSETKCSLNFGSRAMKITTNAYINVEVDYKRLSEDLNKLIESREKDMVEMKQTYEDRILSITTNSEALFAEAVSNSEKSLASVTSLYEKQQMSWKADIFKLQSELASANQSNSNCKMELAALRGRIQRRDYQTRKMLLAEIMSMQLYYAIRSLTSSDDYSEHLLKTVFDNGRTENELLSASVKVIDGSDKLLHLLKAYIGLGDSSASTLLSYFPDGKYPEVKTEDGDLFIPNGKNLSNGNHSEVAEKGSPYQRKASRVDESAEYLANKTDDDKVVECGNGTQSEAVIDCPKHSENSSCIEELEENILGNDVMCRASRKLMESLLEVKKDLDGKGVRFLSQAFHIQLVQEEQGGEHRMSQFYTLLRENIERHQRCHSDREVDSLFFSSSLDSCLSNLLVKEHSLSHVLVDKALLCSVMVLEHCQLKKSNEVLCTRVAKLQDEIGSMETQNALLQEATASAKIELQESNCQLTENITSKAQLEGGINSILQILECSSSNSGEPLSSSTEKVRLERLRIGVSALLDERNNTKKDQIELENQNKNLTNEIVDANKNLELLKVENCLLQQELQAVRSKLEKDSTKQEHLESCMSSLFHLLESKATEDGTREKATDPIIDRVTSGELESRVSRILEDIETFQIKQSDLTKEKEALTNELNGVKEQLNETEERKLNLNNELNITNSKLEEALTTQEQLRSEVNAIFELLNFNKENGAEASFQNESTPYVDKKCDGGKLFAAVSSLVESKTNLEHELTSSTNHLHETIATKEQLENDMSSMFQLFSMSSGGNCDVEPFSRTDSYELSLEISAIVEDNQNLREELCDAQTERESLEKQLTIAKNELQILKTRNKSQSRYSSRTSSQENLPSCLKDLIDGRLQIQEQCSSLNENRKRLDGSFTDLHKEICKLEEKCSGSDTELGGDSHNLQPTREHLNRRLSAELLNTVAENVQLKDEVVELRAQMRILQATSNNIKSFLQNTPGKAGQEVVRTHLFTDLRTAENKDLGKCEQEQVDRSDGNHDDEFEANQSLKSCDVAIQTATPDNEEVDDLSDTISTESTINESFESCLSEAILTETSRKGILDELKKGSADSELMRKEIVGLEQKILTLNNELHLCNKTREELEEEIAALVENGKVMSEKVSDMKEKYEALEQQLVQTVEEKRLFEVKIEQLLVQNMAKERENKTLIEAKTLSEAQNLEEQSRLRETILSLHEENEENKRLSGERKAELENIEIQKKVKESENNALIEAESISDMQHFEDVSKLKEALSALKAESEETKRSLKERTEQLERINAQKMVMEHENKTLVEAKSLSDVQHFEELRKLEKAFSILKAENEETKKSLRERSEQVERINAQKMVIEHKNRTLLEEKSLSDAQHFENLSKLEIALLTLKTENEESKNLLEEQSAQLETISAQKKATEYENKALLKAKSLSDVKHFEELGKIKKTLLLLKEENKSSINQANERGEELDRTLEQKKKLEKEKKALAETSDSTQAHLLELIRKLEQELTELKEDTEENKRLLDEKESEAKHIQDKKKEMEEENSSLLEALASAQDQLVEEGRRLEKELEALKLEKEEIEDTLIAKQKELESIRNQKMETERENKALMDFKVSTQQQFTEIKSKFEKELLEANEENEKCKQLAKEREEELLDLSDRLNSIDNFVQGIEAELTLTKEEKQSYEKMLWSKDREFEDLKINLTSSKDQLHKLGEQLSSMKEERDCLKNELRTRESQRSLLQDQLNCLIDLPELKPGGIEMPLQRQNSGEDENIMKEVESSVGRRRSEGENTKLNADLNLAKEQLLKLKEDVTLSNLQTRNLGTQLSSLRENSNRLEAELSTMRKPRQPRSRSHSLSDETLRLEMELADSKQRIIDLQKKIIDVHNEKAFMVDRLALSEVQLEKVSLALHTLLKEKSNTVVKLEGDVSNYKKEKEELENILAACETGMNIGESKTLLKDQLENVVKTTIALKTQILESKNKVTLLEEELAKTRSENNKMENELTELRVWTKSVSENQSDNVKQFEEIQRLKDELKRNIRAGNQVTSDLEQSVAFYKEENERLQVKFNNLEKATCAKKNEQIGEMVKAMESKERESRVDELRDELQWYKMEKKRLELLLEKHNNECLLSREESDVSKDTKQEIKRMENTMSSLVQAKLRLEEEVSDLNEDKVRLENIEHLVSELLLVEKQKTKLKRNLTKLTSNCGLNTGNEDETINVGSSFTFEEDEMKATLKGNCGDNIPSASKVLLRTLQELENENSTISEENNALKFRILDLEKELEFLTFKLSIKEKSELSGGKKALATVLASVKQQREELQKALNVLSGEKEDLEEEILALKVKSTHLQKDLALTNLQKDNFEVELNALRNELVKVKLHQENELRGNPVQTNFQLVSKDLLLRLPKEEKGIEPEVERKEITIGNTNGLSVTHNGRKVTRKSTKFDKDRRRDSTQESPNTTSRRKSSDARSSVTGKRSKRALPSRSTPDLKSNALPRLNDNSDSTVHLTSACGDLIRFDNEPLVNTGNDNTDYMSGLVRVNPDDDRLSPEGMEDDMFSDTASISSSETMDEDYDGKIELSKIVPDQGKDDEYCEDQEVIIRRAWSLRRLFWGQSCEDPSDLNVKGMPQ